MQGRAPPRRGVVTTPRAGPQTGVELPPTATLPSPTSPPIPLTVRERMLITPNRASPTGPRRILQFDTARTDETTALHPRILAQASPTSGMLRSSMMEASQPARDFSAEAEMHMVKLAFEQRTRKEVEEELLAGLMLDLKKLASTVDADDWMYPQRLPLPFKM